MNVRASEQAIRKAREVLTREGWAESKLLEIVTSRNRKLSSQQRTKFFNGEPIARSTADRIGSFLGLTWEKGDLITVKPEKRKQDNSSDIDELVQKVRSRACKKIRTLHGTMPMLRVSRRVPVDDIYIELNVLEQVSCDRTFSDWRRDFQPDWRSFDRLGLGQAIEEGVPALDMVRKYPKLMVFGKPGSGKTTFLKSLALQCIESEGQLQWTWKNYVPIFITLQKFAKDARKRGRFSLFEYIYHQEFCSWGEKNQQVVEVILEQGRALVLLDGLDEVQGQEYKPVIEEVESFCERFHNNRFLITCRTQNLRYKYEGFTDVEVADFKPEQVNRFIKRWFAVVVDNAESEMLATELIGQLQQPENKQIAELAVTPVLLNLICSVFQGERGNLPKNRTDLYKKGLRDLLEGLDESKGVQREPIYEQLTPEAKEDLLAYLAVTLFEANDYFPQQDTLEKIIAKRLDVSRSKAIKVLRSIEEQSGLIVERSEGFWSFSHLTFQEYFTAQFWMHSSEPEKLQELWHYVLDRRWREVFLLAAASFSPNSAFLLRLIKQQCDLLLDNEILQNLLVWVKDKSDSLNHGNLVAIRAFYFTLAFQICCLSHNHSIALISLLCDALKLDRNLTDIKIDSDLGLALANAHQFIDLKFMNPYVSTHLKSAINLTHPDSELNHSLLALKAQLPCSEENEDQDKETISQWLETQSANWIEQLRTVMIEHRNIGHNWQFSSDQSNLLDDYENINELLVACLNSGFSAEVRQEIEETLLLPIVEIKKRQ